MTILTQHGRARRAIELQQGPEGLKNGAQWKKGPNTTAAAIAGSVEARAPLGTEAYQGGQVLLRQFERMIFPRYAPTIWLSDTP